jgi:hypothetical protein
MTCSSCTPELQQLGTTPANVQWSVVRGNTATLRIDFLQNDETTFFNTTGWTYKATAYDPVSTFLDDIQVAGYSGYVVLTIPATTTCNWGSSFSSVVAELSFDLQVKIPNGSSPFTWTPVTGTICVLGDVTTGGIR